MEEVHENEVRVDRPSAVIYLRTASEGAGGKESLEL